MTESWYFLLCSVQAFSYPLTPSLTMSSGPRGQAEYCPAFLQSAPLCVAASMEKPRTWLTAEKRTRQWLRYLTWGLFHDQIKRLSIQKNQNFDATSHLSIKKMTVPDYCDPTWQKQFICIQIINPHFRIQMVWFRDESVMLNGYFQCNNNDKAIW